MRRTLLHYPWLLVVDRRTRIRAIRILLRALAVIGLAAATMALIYGEPDRVSVAALTAALAAVVVDRLMSTTHRRRPGAAIMWRAGMTPDLFQPYRLTDHLLAEAIRRAPREPVTLDAASAAAAGSAYRHRWTPPVDPPPIFLLIPEPGTAPQQQAGGEPR